MRIVFGMIGSIVATVIGAVLVHGGVPGAIWEMGTRTDWVRVGIQAYGWAVLMTTGIAAYFNWRSALHMARNREWRNGYEEVWLIRRPVEASITAALVTAGGGVLVATLHTPPSLYPVHGALGVTLAIGAAVGALMALSMPRLWDIQRLRAHAQPLESPDESPRADRYSTRNGPAS